VDEPRRAAADAVLERAVPLRAHARRARALLVPLAETRARVASGATRTRSRALRGRRASRRIREAERELAGRRGRKPPSTATRLRTSPPQLVLTFVVFFSVMGWDFIMALTPNWVSDLFCWWIYAGAFITGMAMTALLGTHLRTRYALEAYITPNMFWDNRKVIFAWCIFWGYLFWSQYLPIWYANMPEETWWVFLRFEEPWRTLSFRHVHHGFSQSVPRHAQQAREDAHPMLLASFSVLILCGLWLERHVLVMPSLNASHVWVGLPEIGVTLGFLGLFGWMVQGFLARYPIGNVVDVLEGAGGPRALTQDFRRATPGASRTRLRASCFDGVRS